jgi:DNA-binding transcriptional MerR regulator
MQLTEPYLPLEEIEESLEAAGPHADDEISLADTSISSHSDSTQALDDELDALAEEYERELDRELEELDRASEKKHRGKHALSLDRPPPPSSHVEQVQQSSN